MSDYDFEQFKQDFLNGVSNAADAVANAARDTGDSVGRYKDFLDIGTEIAKLNNTSHGGNMSVCDGTDIWITRTGSRISRLVPADIVQCDWEASSNNQQASMELVVHREIYHALARKAAKQGQKFGKQAIIHAHCLYTNYQSFLGEKIVPVDSEGKLEVPETTVLVCEKTIASAEVGIKLAKLIENGANIAVIRGHGPFAVSTSLGGALQLLSSLEYSAHLLSLLGN